jgi:hypothetical protein
VEKKRRGESRKVEGLYIDWHYGWRRFHGFHVFSAD